MENNKIMLMYGFDGTEEDVIRSTMMSSNLPSVKKVEAFMGKMKIKDILEGRQFNIFNCSLPNEKVILFNSFNDTELDKAIKLIKNNGMFAPILAVITETSIDWTFEYLLEHLIEEREWFKKYGR